MGRRLFATAVLTGFCTTASLCTTSLGLNLGSDAPSPERASLPGWCSQLSLLPTKEPLHRGMTFDDLLDLAAMARDPRATVFICTVYYTPRETGVTMERGFDTTPETRPGLGGRLFPRDFLKAVVMEGCGKLEQPFEGNRYITFDGASWRYIPHPVDATNRPLTPKKSCAVHISRLKQLRNTELQLLSHQVESVFGKSQWEVADTGGGLHRLQIDLYWGEDDPYGPGKDLVRPAGTEFECDMFVPVAAPKGTQTAYRSSP